VFSRIPDTGTGDVVSGLELKANGSIKMKGKDVKMEDEDTMPDAFSCKLASPMHALLQPADLNC
jgi:hypothetical protein